MRITSLTLENYRGFASLELDLDRDVTVLVGSNGSGKSSVLHALVVGVSEVCAGGHSRAYGMQLDERDLHRGARTTLVKVGLRRGSARHWWVAKLPPLPEGEPDHFGDPSFFSGVEFAFMLGTERAVRSASVREAKRPDLEEDFGTCTEHAGYERFIEWFKEREDVENARRVAARDLDLQDPQLRAVREAIAALMPGFDNLRIEREVTPPAMVVTKGEVELRVDQLSDGERNLIAMAGDLARRMVIAAPASEAPRELEGVILIDEIEQHLHPGLQREVLPAMRRAFPNAQFIVTTHSPQVLSSVPASAIVVLDGFAAHPLTAPTLGRDTNAILEEVFGVSERPGDSLREVREIAELIHSEKLEEARARLAVLAAMLSEHDDAVLHLRTKLDFAEAGL